MESKMDNMVQDDTAMSLDLPLWTNIVKKIVLLRGPVVGVLDLHIQTFHVEVLKVNSLMLFKHHS